VQKPILVVMAAGMGHRYGGLKQMDALTKGGEVLLDYSVYDALRAGFGRVIFVIRAAMERDFRDLVLRRIEGAVPYGIAYQELDSFIPQDIMAEVLMLGRSKPWGTGHALLCATPLLDAPFAVINADDFYGREAFALMADYLQGPAEEGAIVPYRLDRTLSAQGSVSRGICTVREGYLAGVREATAIHRERGRIQAGDAELAPDTPVSMNFWGFPLRIIPHLASYFREFLDDPLALAKNECFLPSAIDDFLSRGILKVRALGSAPGGPEPEWFGITYREDKAAALQRIGDMSAQGIYPDILWN
jgi:choline kinase